MRAREDIERDAAERDHNELGRLQLEVLLDIRERVAGVTGMRCEHKNAKGLRCDRQAGHLGEHFSSFVGSWR